jgi:hypothetical protein
MTTNTSFVVVRKQRWVKRLSIGAALIYCLLLSPVLGMTFSSPFVSDCFNNSVEREHTKILLPYGTKDSIYSMECESDSFETAFFTNVNVKASVTFPRVSETTFFANYVNEVLRKEACEFHDTFVQEMSDPQEDLWEEDADERVFHYELNLVSSTPFLMSFYGSNYQYCGGAHGTMQYITKTFWNQGETIHELTLNDLFLPGYREWLFQYCESYFKLNRCGYYSYEDYSWVGFNPENIDSFLLTEKGLLLIFQNYVIGGFDDYPVTLLIPYAELTSIANSPHMTRK